MTRFRAHVGECMRSRSAPELVGGAAEQLGLWSGLRVQAVAFVAVDKGAHSAGEDTVAIMGAVWNQH